MNLKGNCDDAVFESKIKCMQDCFIWGNKIKIRSMVELDAACLYATYAFELTDSTYNAMQLIFTDFKRINETHFWSESSKKLNSATWYETFYHLQFYQEGSSIINNPV